VSQSDLDLVDAALLPPQLRKLVHLIGLPETLQLLRSRGGVPTYIPCRPDSATDLAAVISRAAIHELVAQWPGDFVDLPKADKICAQMRNQYIGRALALGLKSGRQLACELGLSYRQIKSIRAQARRDDGVDPDDLFALDHKASGPEVR